MQSSKEELKVKRFEVTAKLQGLRKLKEGGELKLMAYAFASCGKLVDKKPLKLEKDKARATFDLDPNLGKVTVRIGPDLENYLHLAKHNPISKTLNIVRGVTLKDLVFEIPSDLWEGWYYWLYFVNGDVIKSSEAGEQPICYGEVDIYDVDVHYCILKLPELVLEKIRDGIIDLVVNPLPIEDRFRKIPERVYEIEGKPFDECPTSPRGPIGPPAISYTRLQKEFASLPREYQFIAERFKGMTDVKQRADKFLSKMSLVEKTTWFNTEVLEGVTVSKLLNTNTKQFRELLLDKFQSFRFYICWYPWIHWYWWPYCKWYSLEKIGTAKLNADGSFSRIFLFSSSQKDIPDLWFVVRQNINGVEKVIYRRYPVPCNTYWNHPSGKQVHLVVTDPDAIPCNTPPETDIITDDPWVIPLAVGNHSLFKIHGATTGIAPASLIGKYTSKTWNLAGADRVFNNGPFSGNLELRYLFSRKLENEGIKYYRIKYRVNDTGDWLPLTHDVLRHYSHEDPVTNTITFLPYNLGPQPVGSENYLYEICPKLTPNHAAEPDADWYDLNAHVDRVDGYFNSSSIADGEVTFKIELFDSLGNRVNPASATKPIDFFVPKNDDIWGTILTDPAPMVPDPENLAFTTYILRLRINNESCDGMIYPPSLVPGGATANPCGLLEFTPSTTNVNIPYTAWHPNEFGWYSFKVVRGSGDVPYSATGDAAASSGAGYENPSPTISTMMGSCPLAAFSENLYVYFTGFNGWSRVSGKDKSATTAFMLVPPQ